MLDTLLYSFIRSKIQRQDKGPKINKSSAVAEMGDRLATTDMGRKEGAPVPLPGGELGPHLTQCGLGRGLLQYQVAS